MFKIYDKTEKISIIRLMQTPNLGVCTYWKLMEKFTSATKAIVDIENNPSLYRNLKIYDSYAAISELDKVENFAAKLIFYGEELYPPLLMKIATPPPYIYAKGNLQLLRKVCVAIVGSRNASLNCIKFTTKIAKDCGENGLVVVSGLARGIDTAAHLGALVTGTIAVLGTGIDVCYPKDNNDMYQAIMKVGVIISENMMGTKPHHSLFPKRNRIIAGISRGVLVTESGKQSGSLLTAQYALEYNRDVMATPSSPYNANGEGCNLLIKQGAFLIENITDVVDVIKGFKIREVEVAKSLLEEDKDLSSFSIIDNNVLEYECTEKSNIKINEVNFDSDVKDWLVSALDCNFIDIDDVIGVSPYTQNEIYSAVLELELEGKLIHNTNNQVALVSDY